MAKVKNTGKQVHGFITEDGSQVVVHPGEEKEFNMSEADFKNLQKIMEGMDDDKKPYELSGSAGGVKAEKKSKKEGDEVEMPAQSTTPPAPSPNQPPPSVIPPTEKERQEREHQQGRSTKK